MSDDRGTATSAPMQPSFEGLLGHAGVNVEDVLESLGEGLIVASFAGDLVHWNRAALDMHGVATTAEVNLPLADFQAIFELRTLGGAVVPFDRWPLPRIMRGERVRDLELLLLRKDGDWQRYMTYGGSVIRAVDGSPLLAVLHVRDVTEKRQAEQARERELGRQALLHWWSSRLIQREPTTHVVHALLEELRARLGLDVSLYYRPDAKSGAMRLGTSLGVPAALLSRVDPMPTDTRAALGVGLGLRALGTHPLVASDGRVLGVLVLGSTTREPQDTDDAPLLRTLCQILSAAREREDAVGALHASELALKEAVDNMAIAQRAGHVGSWEVSLDDDGRPTDPFFWSDETYRICGYEPGSVEPSMRLVRDMTHPDDLARLGGIASGEAEQVLDVRIVRADGSIRHVQLRSRSFADARTGKLARRVGTFQDVTEREVALAEVRRSQEELETRVQQRTAELSAANAELETFAYSVSHDLRAPLRAIVGFSHALIEDAEPVLPPVARAHLAHIIAGGTRMSQLVDGILKLTRLSREEMRKEPVDLSTLACEIVDELRSTGDRVVRVDIAGGLVVSADAAMMRVVMHNLLANAWKYTGKTERPEVRVEEERRGDARFVVVRDNGAGFAMAHASQLFQPFHRLHRQDEFPGLGIGLATVERIIRRHSGEMLAEAAPGSGATIGFTVPG